MLDHDVFYNRQRSSYEELRTYMPVFWNAIRELDANSRFAGYTLDHAADEMEQFVKNWFFDTMDEATLALYEDFLNITGMEDKTLQERRALVKATWIGGQKINRPKIKALIRAYFDCDSEVHFTHRLIIKPGISLDMDIEDPGINKIIAPMIPAHIATDYYFNFVAKAYFGVFERLQDPKLTMNTKIRFYDFIMRNLKRLDGTWELDGTYMLGAYYDPVPLYIGMGIIKALTEEQSEASVDILIESRIEEAGKLGQMLRYKFNQQTGADARINVSGQAVTDEGIKAWLVDRSNMWYLDGSFILDGSKVLNAIEIREEI